MNIRIKYGDTYRTINLIVEEDGEAFDLEDVTAISLRIKLNSDTRIARTFTKDTDETGKCYYRPTNAADWTGSVFEEDKKYECELWLTFTDGSTAPVPSVGKMWFYVEARIAAP